MKYLTFVGRIATPAAMVVFMTYEISRSMTVSGGWATAVIIGAMLTAIGVEIVGILSGHALEGFWRAEDQWRALLALALLAIYTVGAVYILRGNNVIAPVPIIAAIVYIVAALVESLERQNEKAETAVSEQTQFDLQQAAKDREIERQLKLQRQADNTAAKLAKIQSQASMSQHEPAPSQHEPARASYTCQHCGATAGKSGAAFRSQAALNAHQAHCPARHNGKEPAAYSNGVRK